MELGMIGLGRMGGNMAQRLINGGHQVGRETPIKQMGAQRSKPVYTSWCPCPPGQARMECDGTFEEKRTRICSYFGSQEK